MSQQIPDGTTPRVDILMGVLNGSAHLPAQLQSLSAQTHKNWALTCSDDASVDSSVPLLRAHAAQNAQPLTLTEGPAQGFAANYLSLIRSIPEQPEYVAFSDQDDIWVQDKLAHALAILAHYGDAPALYCGRRWVWYPHRTRSFATEKAALPHHFKNALIENVAAGNTIVLNPAAARLARDAAHQTPPVFAHDWWLNLLVSGAGGHVHFDNGSPMIWYRQHAGNAIGAGMGWRHQAKRKFGVLRGHFAQRVDGNVAAMYAVWPYLTDDSKRILDRFESARRAGLRSRLSNLADIAPQRQSRLATLGFYGAAGLGRI